MCVWEYPYIYKSFILFFFIYLYIYIWYIRNAIEKKISFFDSDKMRGIILWWLVVALCGVWRGILFTLKRSHTFIPLLLFFAVWLNSGRVAWPEIACSV